MQHIRVWTVLACAWCALGARSTVEHPPPRAVQHQHQRQWHGAERPVRVDSSVAHHWPPSAAWRGGVSHGASITPAAGSEWHTATPAPAHWALLVPYAASPAAATEHYHSHYAHDLGEGIDDIIAGSADDIRYARPVPRGGYTYRPRRPAGPRRRPRPPRPAASPVIIRIHKHRIIRD